MTLLVRKIYVHTCELETLLRQHISNIECLYKNNIVRQHCNDIETILFGNLQRKNMVAMFWQYSMLCGYCTEIFQKYHRNISTKK